MRCMLLCEEEETQALSTMVFEDSVLRQPSTSEEEGLIRSGLCRVFDLESCGNSVSIS